MILGTSSRLVTRAATRTSAPSCAACQIQRRSAHKLVEVELTTDVPSLGRRGDRIPVAPGRARNILIPSGQGLYVVAGKAVSPLRDLMKREGEREAGITSRSKAQAEIIKASQVLDQLTSAETAEDPLAQASDAEQSLLSALSLLPLPLTFHRLTNASSNDLFGSVSIGDVVAAAKEFGVRIEETQGAFEEKDGVEKGRVKSLGEFTFAIQLKALGETFPLRIEVLKETSKE